MIGAPSNFHGCKRHGTDVAADFGKPDIFTWAESGRPTSFGVPKNSRRLGRLKHLDVTPNNAAMP